MGRRKKPVRVKRGNVTVRIYHVKTHGSDSYQVADYSGGTRKLRSFATMSAARKEAELIARRLSKGDGDVLALRSADRAAYLRAIEVLRPTGVPIELAAVLFADAHQKLGGRSLAEAIDFFIKHNATALPQKAVAEVYRELVAAKRADGASPMYIKDLNFRLGKFADSFQCPIGSVSAVDLNAFLRGLESSGRSRNNFRLAIGTLFKFAAASGYLPKTHLDFASVARAKEAENVIEIFTPTEMSMLLAAARPDANSVVPGFNHRYARASLLPLLVLGGFAGMRTAEIERQLWEDISLERGFIRVTAAKGNTAQKRLIPIADNLKQWLALCRCESGLVCEIARTPESLLRLAVRAKLSWKHNALRHSYASYRMAQVKNAAQVSLEMGNSPKMVFRHYRELVTEEESKAWFAIVPQTGAKAATIRSGALGKASVVLSLGPGIPGRA